MCVNIGVEIDQIIAKLKKLKVCWSINGLKCINSKPKIKIKKSNNLGDDN